jgi:hypothetical protein
VIVLTTKNTRVDVIEDAGFKYLMILRYTELLVGWVVFGK